MRLLATSDFTRVNNDVNGNPRYVIHFLALLTQDEKDNLPVEARYAFACKRANKIGGRKYHTRSYGGGIAFVSYSLDDTIDSIIRALQAK